MLSNLGLKQTQLYFGVAFLIGALALAWLAFAASSTVPCAQQIWVGSNPLQEAQQSAGPVSDYIAIGLWDKARISTVQNQMPELSFLGDDDPTYSLTLEFSTQKQPLTAWRYGWVACPFVVDLGGPPLGE